MAFEGLSPDELMERLEAVKAALAGDLKLPEEPAAEEEAEDNDDPAPPPPDGDDGKDDD